MSISHERRQGRRGPVRSGQNLGAGLFLIALAALALWLMRDLPEGSLSAMGPAMLPDWLAVGVGLCGLVLAASAFLKEGEPVENWSLRGPVFVVLAVMAFAVTIRPFSVGPLSIPGLGLVVAGPLAIVIGGYATPDADFRQLLVLALGLTPFCMLLFGDLLNLPIPIFPDSLAGLFPGGWSEKAILRVLAVMLVLAAAAVHWIGRGRSKGPIDVAQHTGQI